MTRLILSAGISPDAWLVFAFGLLLLAALTLAIVCVAVFARTDTPADRISCIIHGRPVPNFEESHDPVETVGDAVSIRSLAVRDRSQVWINPHANGPQGAPLCTGDTVHAWQRTPASPKNNR